MSKIYAGQILEMRIGEYGDDANAVCNLIIGTTKKAFGGIDVMVKKTVVLFRKTAELAEDKLKEGDRVYFDEVVRNPRVYRTSKGTDVETVDMIAEVFTKLTKDQLEIGLAEEGTNMMSADDFKFTDDDRALLAKQAEVSTENDDDLDDVFSA